MDIERIRERITEAEQEISEILYFLTKDTDCYLSDVSVDILNSTILGEKPSTTVGRVSITLHI